MADAQPTQTCSAADCQRPRHARGMCTKHYRRLREHGDPAAVTRVIDPQRGCAVDGCDRPHMARGLCNAHYQRQQKYGDPLAAQPLLRKTTADSPSAIELFRSFLVEDPSGCWNWTGTMTPQGYGRFNYGGKAHFTHRWAYETLVRPIPEGLVLDHLCRNRRCCNPAHLDVVTHQTNLWRGMAPSFITARTNVCKRGHELSEDNVYRQGPDRTGRVCRTCVRDRQRARRARSRS
jgi:hypothetical protein